MGTVLRPIQITPEIADAISQAIQNSDADGEQQRTERLRVLDQRRVKVMAKIDRGYDDFVSGKIPEEFWTRKSQEWEAEVSAIDCERGRLQQPRPAATAAAARILELAKNAVNLYKMQDLPEQRRLLETVLSNCTFDRGSLSPTYSKPFDLLVRGNEAGDWRGRRDSGPLAARAAARPRDGRASQSCVSMSGGVDGTRTRGLRRDRPAF